MRLEFVVHGVPQPQGSAKAFVPKGWKRAIITSDNAKLKPWRQEVAGTAADAMALFVGTRGPVADAVSVNCIFAFQRPKSTSKRVLHKTTKPDIDKLLRGVLDALTGIVFVDDSQVVEATARKAFGPSPGASIVVESL